MKLVRAEIFGFGRWIDTTFDFSNNNFICFYGENEAGKSTLQQFIMYMLFGLAPRKRAFYKPKKSNKIGGRLTISDITIGEYAIERIDGEITCLLPNGEAENEEWLHRQLNGLTREIYTSIYSFSALDLIEIRKMKDDQLSDVLFSVGLSESININKVEKQLDTKMGDLFKKRAIKPLINEQTEELNDLHTLLLEHKSMEASYRNIVIKRDELTSNLSITEEKQRQLQTELTKLEKVHHVLPTITNYHYNEEKLATYRDAIPFPEDGLNRLQKIKDKILPLKSEHSILQKNEEQFKEKLNELNASILSTEINAAGSEILMRKQDYEENVRQYEETEHKRIEMSNKLNEKLSEINLGLVEQDLNGIVFPFHLENTWKEIGENNSQLKREREFLNEENKSILQEKTNLDEEIKKIQMNLVPSDEIQKMQRDIEQFKSYNNSINKQDAQQQEWKEMKRKKGKNVWRTIIFSAVLATSLLLGYLIFNKQLLAYASIVIFLIGLFQVMMTSSSLRDMERLLNIQREDKLDVNVITEAERNKFERILQVQLEYATELSTLQSDKKKLTQLHVRWEERNHILSQKEHRFSDEVNGERFQYPFLNNIEPNHWSDLLLLLKGLKHVASEKGLLTQTVDSLQNKNKLFVDMLDELAKFVGWEKASVEDVVQLIAEDEDKRKLLQQYEQFNDTNKIELEKVNETISVYSDELNKLFFIAEVSNEDDFLINASEIKEKQMVLDEKERINQQLASAFSEDVKQQILKEKQNGANLEIKIAQLQKDIEESDSKIKSIHQDLATVTIKKEQMEMSENYSETMHKFQLKKGMLQKLAEEWAVLKVAKEVLVEAKQTYRNKYLAEVLHKTSLYFSKLTKAAYTSVYAPTATELFQVETSDHMRFTVEELSQGTIDQLYIALRLAISKVMSDKYVLPFIIDDAFVHFDGERTEQMINLINEISFEQQVLLFTCKADIVKQIPDEKVLYLKSGNEYVKM